MSIEEFLDGMPTFDERNFSQFYPSSFISRRIPVYIKTTDTPSEQVIVNDTSTVLLRYFHKKWDIKKKDKKRENDEIGEESGPSTSTSKRSRI
ncbi:DET1- and DDB1-associated protein 1-like [Aphis gossypii]|uniref:DET1- and DDB1-associated protein 1-like n=1 Tax=Aphis gossypii TaxID=80765 RepID=UPI00100FC029|nr:DET1- and DDB1-associated protein 1-like [Aphis gossypii]XP_050062151.1 DET1- and DDB1-associated protein 1-like [Aphis gossypii]XP_050063871.1 DET1- and DDB1-associated protein 1-like [Aphis gossypii]XP_050063872.1 DET1- and DDB1-associated protein 1-like [Aphis gossypii]XP_050063874.1 DET1- and DDB1-associated protein 1-like [Aphis gossypii]